MTNLTMRRLTASALLAGALLVGADCPARAAAPPRKPISCTVQEPRMRGDWTLDLLIGVNVPTYTGKPFAFDVVSRRWSILAQAYHYKHQRYAPTGRGHHTRYPVPNGYELMAVHGGAFGTACASWKYRA